MKEKLGAIQMMVASYQPGALVELDNLRQDGDP